jgi:hypothetical protein
MEEFDPHKHDSREVVILVLQPVVKVIQYFCKHFWAAHHPQQDDRENGKPTFLSYGQKAGL